MEQTANKTSYLKNTMTTGLIIGFGMIIYAVILYVFDALATKNFAIGLVNYAIMIAGIVYGTINYRDKELGGEMSYSKALGFGVVSSIFASFAYGIFTYLLYTVIDPGLMEKSFAIMEEMYLERGMSEDQVEEAVSMAKKMTSPVIMVVSSFFMFTIMGLIFSLITSIFLKKEGDPFASAMNEVKEEENQE